MTYVLLAWRNIWRTPVRSLVVMGAVIIGIWAAISLSGFITGVMQNYISHAIENVVSHLQLHHPRFTEYYENQFFISEPDSVLNKIRTNRNVRSISVRAVSQAMLSTSAGVRGLLVKGVDPKSEKQHSNLHDKIVKGTYFQSSSAKEILVSKRIADELKIKPRSKIVLTLIDLDEEMTAAAFRTAGIFETGNNVFDEGHAYITFENLKSMLSSDTTASFAHEIAINLHSREDIDSVHQEITGLIPHLKASTYKEISPDLELYESMLGMMSIIYLGIIMLALIFGIINTMLMAVLERSREFGMLMAIGMNKFRVFMMIVTETLMLTLFAAPFGMLVAYGTIQYFMSTGIDLSAFADSLKEFGISTVVYPEVYQNMYTQAAIALILTAVLASIYPALKAIRLRPVEAIRKL